VREEVRADQIIIPYRFRSRVGVEEVHYFGLSDFVYQLGGYLEVLELLLALIMPLFIYKEYTRFMASRIRGTQDPDVSLGSKRLDLDRIQRLFE